MSILHKKALPNSRIPEALWVLRKLTLPEVLRAGYESELRARGLFDIAKEGTTKRGIFGGATVDETDEHFAHRFAASSGRVEFCILGPDIDFYCISDALLTTFSEGEVALLDIPCGTGAASASLVSSLIALRGAGSLPRLPLRLDITAGDFSLPSRDVFEGMLRPLVAPAAEEGIGLEYNAMHWDATRGDSTAALVDAWFESSNLATDWVVLVSNFSGTLSNQATFDQFKPCLEHIAARLHNRRATIVWIEPAVSGKTQGLMKRLKVFAQERLSWFFRASSSSSAAASADFDLQHPLKDEFFASNVTIERFDRK